MSTVEEDVLKTWDILFNAKNMPNPSASFGPTYLNSNENISEYIGEFNIRGGNVLTVAASGDQALYSVLSGAKKIDVFDVNKIAYYIFSLKLAAIKGLSREDYLSYFPTPHTSRLSLSIFKKKVYDEFKDNLEGNAREYWDTLYELIKNPREFKKFSINVYVSQIKQRIPYYSKYNYDRLQSNLKTCNINYYEANLLNLPDEIKINKNGYDAILLSNIYDYLPHSEDDYIKFLNQEIAPLLKERGKCLAYYEFIDRETFNSLRQVELPRYSYFDPRIKILRK